MYSLPFSSLLLVPRISSRALVFASPESNLFRSQFDEDLISCPKLKGAVLLIYPFLHPLRGFLQIGSHDVRCLFQFSGKIVSLGILSCIGMINKVWQYKLSTINNLKRAFPSWRARLSIKTKLGYHPIVKPNSSALHRQNGSLRIHLDLSPRKWIVLSKKCQWIYHLDHSQCLSVHLIT